MTGEPTDVMIAAYLYRDPARLDYQAVVDAGVKIEGAVCVSSDHAGELHVDTAAGATIGGGVGEPARLQVENKITEQAAEVIPVDGAGLIVAYPRSSADGIDRAVTRATKKAIGEADAKTVEALKKALAGAQEKVKQPAGQATGDQP